MATRSEKFPIRGVLEGFYGVFYTFPERNDLIRFIGENGYNLYVYGPKNDRQHRARWWEPYPPEIMEQFAITVRTAEEAGVTFCYSIGSGVSMSYSSEQDFENIANKFQAFYDIGVRAFSILLDDISADFRFAEDKARFASFAEAHADVSNRLFTWLKKLDPACTLSMCPTDYHGTEPSAYMFELGEKLHPDIDVFYTGPDICSAEISAEAAGRYADALKRRPLLWDNYPVNDLSMRGEMHIGPIRDRASDLYCSTNGLVVNVMCEAEASKVALLTFSDYMQDPDNYDPEASWLRALRQIAGEAGFGAVRLFAENSLRSCLKEETGPLNVLAERAVHAMKSGVHPSTSREVEELEQYTASLDEACYYIKNRLQNIALRNNLLPWIELLEHYHWMSKRALLVLKALETGEDYEEPLRWMTESLEGIAKHPKRMGGEALMALSEYVQESVRKKQSPAAEEQSV